MYVVSFPRTPFSILNCQRRNRKYDPFKSAAARPFLEASRHIDEKQPKIVVSEQVKGVLHRFLNGKMGEDFVVDGNAQAGTSSSCFEPASMPWPWALACLGLGPLGV